jgi:hypothetical protein
MCFDVENECIRKKFKNVTQRIFFFKLWTQKDSIFWEFFLDVSFLEYFKCQPTWCLLQIIDWINFDLVLNFWNQDREAPKGHWC